MAPRQLLLTFNKLLLLSSIAMYFGTGWSLVLFSFPTAHELTPANYYSHFVPQVTAATNFFRVMTMVMIVSCIILIIEEWRTRLKWYGVGILLAVVVATALTILYIFPYNRAMAAGITSATELTEVLRKWMRLNIIRVLLWTVQWLLALAYFVALVNKQRHNQFGYVS